MRRAAIVAFAIFGAVLVATAQPAAAAATQVASEHETFGSGAQGEPSPATLTNVSVEGSGTSATVTSTTVNTTVTDSFESGGLTGYNGDTGDFTVVSGNANTGSKDLSHNDGDGKGVITNDTGAAVGYRVSAQVEPGVGEAGVVLVTSQTGRSSMSGYSAVANGGNGKFALRRYNSGGRTDIKVDATGAVSASSFQKITLTVYENDTIVADLDDPDGSDDVTLTTKNNNHDPTVPGVLGFEDGDIDDFSFRTRPQSGEYVGANHTVSGATEMFANLTEVDGADATVTFEEYDSGWQSLASTTVSSAQNVTASVSPTTNTLRTRVTYSRTGAGNVTLGSEGVLKATGQAVSGTITDARDGTALDGATVRAVNTSTQTVNATATTNASGGYSLSVADGTYEIQSEASGFDRNTTTVTVSGSNVSGIDLQLGTTAPQVDNGQASPTGSVNGQSTTLSIPVSDANFGGFAGDSLDVEWYVAGSRVATTTGVTSNQTVSQSVTLADPTTTWRVEVTDDAGETTTSQQFTVDRPPLIEVYNESSETLIGQQVNVSIDSQDSGYAVNASTNSGTYDLGSAPTDETLFVTLESAGYVDTSFYITNSSRDYAVVMLPVTDPNATRYEQSFTLRDGTGRYPPRSSRLRVVEAINGTSGTVEAIATDARFSSNNLVLAFLVERDLYSLEIVNQNGSVRRYGPFTAIDDGEVEVLELAALEVRADIQSGWYFDAERVGTAQNPAIRVVYRDPENLTSIGSIAVENLDRNSTVTTLNPSGTYGRYTATVALNKSRVNESTRFNVSLAGTRDGDSISDDVQLGGVGDLFRGVPVSDTLLTMGGWMMVVSLTSFVVIRSPRVAPAVGTGAGSALTAVGVLSIPAPALGIAGAISLLAVYSRGGGQ